MCCTRTAAAAAIIETGRKRRARGTWLSAVAAAVAERVKEVRWV